MNLLWRWECDFLMEQDMTTQPYLPDIDDLATELPDDDEEALIASKLKAQQVALELQTHDMVAFIEEEEEKGSLIQLDGYWNTYNTY